MAQADSIPTTNLSSVTLTRKGERYAAAHSHKHEGGPRPVLRTRRRPLTITKLRRARIEELVDVLLGLLDVTDGDPDLEPYLGDGVWGGDDREGDGSDDEPSLGATEVWLGRRLVDGSIVWPGQSPVIDDGMDQSSWFFGCCDTDLEGEHDGREPDVDGEDGGDDEPSVCSPAYRHNMRPENDLELDFGESGVADEDGLGEAMGVTA